MGMAKQWDDEKLETSDGQTVEQKREERTVYNGPGKEKNNNKINK